MELNIGYSLLEWNFPPDIFSFILGFDKSKTVQIPRNVPILILAENKGSKFFMVSEMTDSGWKPLMNIESLLDSDSEKAKQCRYVGGIAVLAWAVLNVPTRIIVDIDKE